MADLVKTTIFYTNVDDFPELNQVYAQHMPDPPPARSAPANVELPRGLLISIDAIAVIPAASDEASPTRTVKPLALSEAIDIARLRADESRTRPRRHLHGARCGPATLAWPRRGLAHAPGTRPRRLGPMLSHRTNVASIISRRAETAGLVDLIKPPIGHRINRTTRIHRAISAVRRAVPHNSAHRGPACSAVTPDPSRAWAAPGRPGRVTARSPGSAPTGAAGRRQRSSPA
jgi:endoribonuclease L-PSP